MAKSEWGSKRKCLKCGTFFYDMGKNNFSCPKCKESYSPDSYEETKTKQLLKMAKETEASAADEESLDEETLLKMFLCPKMIWVRTNWKFWKMIPN